MYSAAYINLHIQSYRKHSHVCFLTCNYDFWLGGQRGEAPTRGAIDPIPVLLVFILVAVLSIIFVVNLCL